jgi:hypothetical protein
MKKIITYTTLLFLLISCNKDEGNYNYSPINEIKIEGINESYSILKGVENLKISPKITSTKENVKYEYKWQFAPSETHAGEIISTEKDLDWPISLNKGSYTLYYKVLDTETGIEWKTYTNISISYPITRGYLLACEDKEGFFRLDMIAMPEDGDTLIMKDLLVQEEGQKIKGAKHVAYTGATSPSQAKNIKLWIIGENSGYWIDPQTFTYKETNQFKSLIFTSKDVPSNFAVTNVAPVAPEGRAPSYRFMRGNNGWIFSSMLSVNGDFYANPINYISGENNNKTFNTSPYLMYTAGYLSGILAYDTDNERFVYVNLFSQSMNKMADGTGDPFPWNNKEIGRTLKYAENTRNTDGGSYAGNSFAIMYEKENPKNQWIYKFVASSRPQKHGVYQIKNNIAVHFTNANLFAFSSSRTIVFFVQNDKLFAYDYNKNSERIKEIDFGNNGDEITMIRFDIQNSDRINELFIATYNASGEGTLRMLTLDTSSPDDIKLIPNEKAIWKGLGKVKDINWRNN